MWTRIPVGRPRVFQAQPWHPLGVDDLGPTVAYLWDVVSVPFATTQRAYVDFSNEFDTLSPTMVRNWYCIYLFYSSWFLYMANRVFAY